jgi:hypothetical protein
MFMAVKTNKDERACMMVGREGRRERGEAGDAEAIG